MYFFHWNCLCGVAAGDAAVEPAGERAAAGQTLDLDDALAGEVFFADLDAMAEACRRSPSPQTFEVQDSEEDGPAGPAAAGGGATAPATSSSSWAASFIEQHRQ
jgi:hypothetical protein